jgi:hypothetical protein
MRNAASTLSALLCPVGGPRLTPGERRDLLSSRDPALLPPCHAPGTSPADLQKFAGISHPRHGLSDQRPLSSAGKYQPSPLGFIDARRAESAKLRRTSRRPGERGTERARRLKANIKCNLADAQRHRARGRRDRITRSRNATRNAG